MSKSCSASSPGRRGHPPGRPKARVLPGLQAQLRVSPARRGCLRSPRRRRRRVRGRDAASARGPGAALALTGARACGGRGRRAGAPGRRPRGAWRGSWRRPGAWRRPPAGSGSPGRRGAGRRCGATASRGFGRAAGSPGRETKTRRLETGKAGASRHHRGRDPAPCAACAQQVAWLQRGHGGHLCPGEPHTARLSLWERVPAPLDL